MRLILTCLILIATMNSLQAQSFTILSLESFVLKNQNTQKSLLNSKGFDEEGAPNNEKYFTKNTDGIEKIHLGDNNELIVYSTNNKNFANSLKDQIAKNHFIFNKTRIDLNHSPKEYKLKNKKIYFYEEIVDGGKIYVFTICKPGFSY